MRIFNKDKTQEIFEYDEQLGYLENSTLVIHHDAVETVEEVGHYETIREYPNGGKDVEWVVDVEGVEGHEAYDEEEQILIYIPYTSAELERMELEMEKAELEEWLHSKDYIGTKIATGRATIAEYADVIEEMRAKANRINEIDERLSAL